MTRIASSATGRRRRPAWLYLAAGFGGLMILLPILTAMFGGSSGPAPTAFAAAPEGNYAVVVRSEGAVDVIDGVNAATGETFELARIPHLDGYTSYAAVSPDGQKLAAVVADAGQPATPIAALLLVDLETGATTRVAEEIDQLQQPVWANDSLSVVVTRTIASETGFPAVKFLRATNSAIELREIGEVSASGAYPVGFDSAGRLFAVSIGSEGSVLLRDFAPLVTLGPGATRDWRLSPDGTALAYIDVVTEGGLKYLPRVVDLTDEVKGSVSGASASEGETAQGIGVAWEPRTGSPVFGFERGEDGAGVSAQSAFSADSGFDVPLSFSPDGSALAVQHWTGDTFANPGDFTIRVHSADGVLPLESASRFYGWARR